MVLTRQRIFCKLAGRLATGEPCHGGRCHARARRIPARSYRRHYQSQGSAQTENHSAQPRLPQTAVPALWAQRLSASPRKAGSARSGRFGLGSSTRCPSDLLRPSLLEMWKVFQRRHVGLGSSGQSLHVSRDRIGGAFGGGRRSALSGRKLALVAGPPRVCPLRHRPELGGGGGEKKAKPTSTPIISTGPWTASPGTSPPMNCTTGRTACCRSSTTALSSGLPTRSWTTIPARMTSGPSSVVFGRVGPAEVGVAGHYHRWFCLVSRADS